MAQGKHIACKAPLGYLRRDQVEDDGPRDARLVPDPAADGLIRRGFEARARGASYQAVADLWGVSRSHARYLLRNRAYLGFPAGSDARAHEPLVSEELFAAVQQTFEGPGRRTRWGQEGWPAGLLSGTVQCAGCGHLLRDVNGGSS